MANIRPISDLRNKFNDIAKICHECDEPVFITKNGQESLVVMSNALYEQMTATIELYEKLSVAELRGSLDGKLISHDDILSELKEMLDHAIHG